MLTKKYGSIIFLLMTYLHDKPLTGFFIASNSVFDAYCVNRRHCKKTAPEQRGRSFNILGYLTLTIHCHKIQKLEYRLIKLII